ncbi:MAG: hypothetical protein D6696_14415 [Acidobacteria bacterium]|nr:MAG: hypothetical protein D6696_14415 [Acidobacteriota bacterium]
MGVFTNSICLPGDRGDVVRAALVRWLATRGFELSDEPVLFDLDAESERSAFLLTHEGWTVLCYSNYEEEPRLIHELRTLGEPLLYLWVYDSSAWGFDLLHRDRFVGSFNSDPDDHATFDDLPLGSAERPRADPQEICRLLGRPELAGRMAEIMRERAVFREDVCRAFCQLLGADAAMASYDELECGDQVTAPGWRIEQLLFVRRGARRPPPRDLHQQRLTQRNPAAGQLETGTVDIPLTVLEEVRRSRRRARFRWLVLQPVAWSARQWRRLVEILGQLGRRLRLHRLRFATSDLRPTFHVAGTDLINPLHGCRITLPPGAEPAVVSCKPSAVFAFVAHDVLVTCTARRREKLREVLRRPDGSAVEDDERYFVAGLRARRLLFRLPPGFRADVTGPSYLGLHIVETERALYVFLYNDRHHPRPELEQAVRDAVASFRLENPPAGGRAATERSVSR